MDNTLFRATPSVWVADNRGLPVRTIAYHRHPDMPRRTDTRITRHHFNAQGAPVSSVDPRLAGTGNVNVSNSTDLSGEVFRTQSADAGTVLKLSGCAGQSLLTISNVRTAPDGREDAAEAVLRTWHYEAPPSAGRLLAICERLASGTAQVAERFVYAGDGERERSSNLVGQCVGHYDPAGMLLVDSIGLTGATRGTTRRLLRQADNVAQDADWQGSSSAAWDALLEDERYTTLSTTDATGTLLTLTDVHDHRQRTVYDVVGRLAGSWVRVAGAEERVILNALHWSAAGQKVQEEHGNGVMITFEYEPSTQRLTRMKTRRPLEHPAGAKVLQDLVYGYDPVGNVLQIRNDAEETRFWRNQKVIPDNTYVYDSLYQLISASGCEMASAGRLCGRLPRASGMAQTDPVARTRYTRDYRYDEAGNLLQIRHCAPASRNHYTLDVTLSGTSNRGLSSALAGAPGEVEALFTAGGQQKWLQPGQPLTWTPREELRQVILISREGAANDDEVYRYDGGRQRILKASRRRAGGVLHRQRVLYLPGVEIRSHVREDTVTERLQALTLGEGCQAQVRLLHWECGKPDELVNDQVRFSYEAPGGSHGLEVDDHGLLMSVEHFYPYGGTAVFTARSQVEVSYKVSHYSGKERDASGLYYYGYRYYQPWAGRWLSADPAGLLDGLNLFRMVHNNPLRYRDVQGAVSEDSFKSLLGLVQHFWNHPNPSARAVEDEYHRRSVNDKLGARMSRTQARQQLGSLEYLSASFGSTVKIFAQGQEDLTLRQAYEGALARPRPTKLGYYRIIAPGAMTRAPAQARINVAAKPAYLPALARAVTQLTVSNPSSIAQAKVTAFDQVGDVAESAVIYLKQQDLLEATRLKDSLTALLQTELAGTGLQARDGLIKHPTVGLKRLGKGVDYKEFSDKFLEASQGSIAVGVSALTRDVLGYRRLKPSATPKEALRHVLENWGYTSKDAALVKRRAVF